MEQLTRSPHIGALAEKVAERLRGRLAEKKIRHKEMQLAQGWSKTTAYRKINGLYPLDADELEIIWEAFGISPAFLFHGDDGPRPSPGQLGDQVSERSGVQSPEGARPSLRLVTDDD